MYSYEEVLDQIENGRRFGNRPGVEITGIMLEQMGQPQNGMPFIHVAGTNGKGSVCAFLTSVFREAGLKVGTFISPHLIDFEERTSLAILKRFATEAIAFEHCEFYYPSPAFVFGQKEAAATNPLADKIPPEN